MGSDHLFIGVDIQPGKRPYTYACITQERELEALGRGDLAEVVAYAAGSGSAWVCVNAPGSLSNGSLSKPGISDRYQPAPNARQRKHLRAADYELMLQGVAPFRVFEKRSQPPLWIQNGLALYDQLAANGFQRRPASNVRQLVLEGHAEASYKALLPGQAYPGSSLEGRIQRQLLCSELKLPVPDAMEALEEITRYR